MLILFLVEVLQLIKRRFFNSLQNNHCKTKERENKEISFIVEIIFQPVLFVKCFKPFLKRTKQKDFTKEKLIKKGDEI